MQVENVDCVDVLDVDRAEGRLDVEEDIECLQVGCVECVDERLEVIEDVESIHVDNGHCSCILDLDL